MCGIFAFFLNRKVNDNDIYLARKATKLLNHRGPDDYGEWVDKKKGVFIGHTRLSILDLSRKSSQPMKKKNVVLSFNGEIYNFKDLKEKLNDFKIQFKSTGDTEVLLNFWNKFGYSYLKNIDGMFAFIIWDGKKGYIVRDKFGEKQLYYLKTSSGIYISSEISNLVETYKVNKKISDENKTAFLSLGYIPSPYTAYENIFCLNPATVIEIEKGSIAKEKKYWDLNKNYVKYNKINNNYLDDFHNKLISSIKNRLNSDAPKCLFLSSGIDSTLIASIIAKEIKEKIQCLTIGFKNFSSIDELQNSLKIAKYLKLPQKKINLKISSKEITSKNLLKMYGQPNDNLTIIPVKKMTEVAKKLNFKVGLTGIGGDEITKGYNKQRFIDKYIFFYSLPQIVRKFIYILSSPFLGFNKKIRIFKNLFAIPDRYIYLALKNTNFIHELKELPKFDEWSKRLFGNLKIKDFKNQISYFDFTNVMPNSRLICFDHGSMSVGHELRTPYLNSDLISAYNAISPENIKDNQQKYVFRKILDRYLPKKLVFKYKKGFVFPYSIFNKSNITSKNKKNIKEFEKNPSYVRFKTRKLILNEFLNN